MNNSTKLLGTTLVMAVLALSVVAAAMPSQVFAWVPNGIKFFGNSNGGNAGSGGFGGNGGNGGTAACIFIACIR
ncbi:MAG: hypothetical protein AB7U98_03765 [Candidatus Nitrosocosmicus sp.]